MGDATTGRRGTTALVWALALLAALPALVLAVASVGEGWQSASDHAPIELRVRDVGTADTPLVGAYSRYGWNHPGPAPFYALAPAHRLVGSADGLLVGSALVSAAAAGVAVVLAGRRGGTALAAMLAGLVLALSLAMGTELLRDPWNPWVAVLPFLACVVAGWAVTTGSPRSLPVAVAAGSFSAQAHVGYVPLVGAVALVVAGALVAHRGWRPPWRTWVLVGAGVAVVLWLPVAVEQVTGDPGNLTQLADQAGDPGDEPPGFDGVRSYLLPHLGPWPAWYEPSWLDPLGTGGRPAGLPLPPVGLVAFAAGTALAAWRRCRRPLLLAGVVAAAWAGGAVAASQVTGVGPYLTRWAWVLGLLLWLSAAWSLWSAGLDLVLDRLGDRAADVRERGRRPAAVLALATVGALAILAVLDVRGAPLPIGDDDGITEVTARTVATVERLADDRTGDHPGDLLVEVRTTEGAVFEMPAVVVGLERAGYRVRVDPPAPNVFGDHRSGDAAGDRPADLVVVVRADAEPPADPAALPEAVLGGLDPARAEVAGPVDQLRPDERTAWPAVDATRPACEAAAVAHHRGEPVELSADERDRCDRLEVLAPRARWITVVVGSPLGDPEPTRARPGAGDQPSTAATAS